MKLLINIPEKKQKIIPLKDLLQTDEKKIQLENLLDEEENKKSEND